MRRHSLKMGMGVFVAGPTRNKGGLRRAKGESLPRTHTCTGHICECPTGRRFAD